MLFYGTPILYSIDMFAKAPIIIKTLMNLNPVGIIITCYRDILYWKNTPHIISLLIVIGASMILCTIGLIIFRKLSKGFAEEV